MIICETVDYFLFQKLYSLSGHWAWLDFTGVFLAEFLIFLMPILVLVFYFFTGPKNQSQYRHKFIQLVCAVGLAVLIKFLIGLVYLRPRPSLTHPDLIPLLIAHSSQSFPSGHATLAFALALATMMIDKNFGILFFILAFLISMSRVFVGVHYPFDILGGLLVAALSAYLVAKIFRSCKIK